MPVIHKPAMRKFSFRGAVAVVCDQSVWSSNWTQVQYICARAEWKNQLTLYYNAVLIEGSSLQKCYGILTGNWLPILWRHMLLSSNGAALCNISISTAVRISNLALKCFLFLKYYICILAQRPAFLAENFVDFSVILGNCLGIVLG